MKLAIGYLGWGEDEAMRADPLAIQLGMRGFYRQQDGLFRAIYGANGTKLPPPQPDEDDDEYFAAPGRQDVGGKIISLMRSHNARIAAARRQRRPSATTPPASRIEPDPAGLDPADA